MTWLADHILSKNTVSADSKIHNLKICFAQTYRNKLKRLYVCRKSFYLCKKRLALWFTINALVNDFLQQVKHRLMSEQHHRVGPAAPTHSVLEQPF